MSFTLDFRPSSDPSKRVSVMSAMSAVCGTIFNWACSGLQLLQRWSSPTHVEPAYTYTLKSELGSVLLCEAVVSS